MVLTKITIDNIVRYIPITEKTKEKEIKPEKKLVHFLVSKTKVFLKITKVRQKFSSKWI